MGVFKVWSSSADDCTCSLCAKLEGTAVKFDEVFEIAGRSVMDPPLHDGCRCRVSWVDESLLEPRLVRAYKAFEKFSYAASRSQAFQQFVTCFYAAQYFLEQLASASDDDLALSGLSQTDFKAQLRDIQSHRDQIFNAALKRAYDHAWGEAKLLKTELGRRSRMERWLQGVLASQALSSVNLEYLKELFPGF
ncbi:MAG: phage head morphogenesis protein [Clostridia bacterium]|nr:phage head morphogenesis protein [Clostridia bacterium]